MPATINVITTHHTGATTQVHCCYVCAHQMMHVLQIHHEHTISLNNTTQVTSTVTPATTCPSNRHH